MMIQAAQHQAFARILQQETEAIKVLLDVLQREHQALGRRDVALIHDILAEKEQQLAQLDQLAQQRNQLLQQLGLSTDKSGFDSFIASDSSGLLAKHWAGLEGLLRECQRQNQVNGTLLEAGKQVAQQTLSILTGQDMSQNELYNQSGKTSSDLGKGTSIKV